MRIWKEEPAAHFDHLTSPPWTVSFLVTMSEEFESNIAVTTKEFCCTKKIGMSCGVYYNGFKLFHFVEKSYSKLTVFLPPGAFAVLNYTSSKNS